MLSLFSHIWLFVTPWTGARQAPLSMGLSRQKYQSELPCPLRGESSWPGDQIHISCIEAGSSLNLKKKKQLRLSQPYYSILSPLTIYPNPSWRAGNSSTPMEWFGEQLFPGSTYKVKAVEHNLWWADHKINPKHQVLHEMIPNNHLLTDINWSEWAPKLNTQRIRTPEAHRLLSLPLWAQPSPTSCLTLGSL